MAFTEWIGGAKVVLYGRVETKDGIQAARRKGITKNKRRGSMLGIRVPGRDNGAMKVPGYEGLWVKNRAHCRKA